MNLVIAGVPIRADAEGRYCLNDLHRAAGGEKRHQPSDWLRIQQTQDLIAELAIAGIPGIPGIESKQGLGTYVAKELVYAYAMWISAAFHLKVIRAYDAMVTQPTADPMTILSDPAAMRGLLLTYTEKVIALKETLAEQAPKVEALDRIATYSDGSFCIRDAAKNLQIQEKVLRQWLSEHDWIYRRPMGSGWLAYSEKLKAGLLEHKITTGTKADGSAWTDTQVRVTAKGMAKLALLVPPTGFVPPARDAGPRPHA
ncbi:DNA-binding protein [Azoarcus indigens]|uniref:Phage antirepressor YoqD-like protein n=1 Tax=Azoarcus indigens TaxID=29545 RepID=A0A4R6DWI9_9RHOO|nr:phage antirepressor KilAC domain-containing protein [Azoarcus indigens]NMG64392.1 DNA-binding protein [Azoarcus indigens]TDN49154.1 phage antirepressor YoqD-like protein [Azoarcus indigens]